MLKLYRDIIKQYPSVPPEQERRLIEEAQSGSKKSKDEIVYRHLKFLTGRIRRKVFPSLLKKFEDDLLAEVILILYSKVDSYDLGYCDQHGQPKPVKFTSYVWKRVDGFIIDFLKREIQASGSELRTEAEEQMLS